MPWPRGILQQSQRERERAQGEKEAQEGGRWWVGTCRMGCGASKPPPFDWATQNDPRPEPPLYRTKSGTPTEERMTPREPQPDQKLPPSAKLIRTNTSLMGDEALVD